jgi:predicted DNA-binding transcriptional regulator YafY
MSTDTKFHRLFRLILFLSNSYPKTKEECISFLAIGDTAFYSYCNVLKETGFDLHQKDGKYWIDHSSQDFQVLRNVLHFSEEETYLLSKSIDMIGDNQACATRLKQKLAAFLNQDKTIETYIHKEKSLIVQSLRKAQQQRKQILLHNYASGNSQTVKNRMVEPFEFKDDFNLVWAFDIELKQNRQFKICRIEDVQETLISWEYERSHRSKPVDIFRNTGDLDKRIEFRLNLKARNLLVEEYPLSERCLEKLNNNQFLLKAQVAKYEGPGRFVLGLAEDVRIIGDGGFLVYLDKKIRESHHLIF